MVLAVHGGDICADFMEILWAWVQVPSLRPSNVGWGCREAMGWIDCTI